MTGGVLIGKLLAHDGNGGALVDIGTGTVTAVLSDATLAAPLGAEATLLPRPGGYEVISVRSVAAGERLAGELVPNGGFELGQTGWDILWDWNRVQAQPWEISTDDKAAGSRSLRVRATPGEANPVLAWLTNAVRVDPGRTHRVACWARLSNRGTSVGDLRLRLSMISAASQQGAVPFGEGAHPVAIVDQAPTADWVVYQGDWICPPGDGWMTPVVTVTTTATDLDLDVFVDGVSVRRRIS